MLVDAHAHLDRYDLVDDRALETAIAEITRNKIFTISNSMDPESYRRNVEIGEMSRWVLPTFGVHPWNAARYVDSLASLSRAIEQSPMLGEIGLDYHFVKDSSAYPAQKDVFEFFLAAAKEQKKVVTVHTKGAERDVLELLDRHEIRRAIVHWYSGPLDIFRELAARKLYFTVGREVLQSSHIQTIAQEIPVGRLLTETDNPGGSLSLTGKPGMPALVKDVVRAVAEARKTTIRAIEDTVQANMLELIRDDPWFVEAKRRGQWQFE